MTCKARLLLDAHEPCVDASLTVICAAVTFPLQYQAGRLSASLHDCRMSHLIDGLLQIRIQLIRQVVTLCQRSPLISDLQDPG